MKYCSLLCALLLLAPLAARADGPTVTVEKVYPQKILYAPDEKISATITLSNHTATDQAVTVRCTALSQVADATPLGELSVTVPAGKQADATLSFPAAAYRFGVELVAEAVQGGQVLARASDALQVAPPTDTNRVGIEGGWSGPPRYATRGVDTPDCLDVAIPAGAQDVRNHYINLVEFYGWPPEHFHYLTPTTPEWFDGLQQYHWTLLGTQRSIQELHQRGVKAVFYVFGNYTSGPQGRELIRRHPDWALRSADGGLCGSFDVGFLDAWPQMTLANVHQSGNLWSIDTWDPQTMQFHADGVVAVTKALDWDGFRYDAAVSLDQPLGTVNYLGQPLGRGQDEDQISARNVKIVYDTIHAAFPNFVFQHNIEFPGGAFRKMDEYYQAWASRGCAMMSEPPREDYAAANPFHKWTALRDHITEQADAARKYGGSCYIFPSSPWMLAPLDVVYHEILTYAGGAHVWFASKHDSAVTGKLGGDRFYRPGPKGPEMVYYDPATRANVGAELLKQPVEGWTAALDPDGSLGLVFLMDYNYLMWLYNCLGASTVEWFYDRVALPPGRAWETRLYAVVVEKIPQVSYASPNVIASTRFEDHRPQGLYYESAFHPSVVPLQDFSVADEVEEFYTHKRTRIGSQKYPATGGGLQATYSPVPKDPIVLHEVLSGTTAAGQPVADQYEVYYDGASQTGFSIAAGGSPYQHPVPPKQKVFLKPAQILWQPHQPRKLLYLAGLHHQEWGLLAAAQKLGYQVDTGALATSFTGTTLSLFPGSYDEMLAYDTVVLTGIDAGAFGDFGREMLLDFVKAGGKLVVTGGFYAYGEGGYKGTQFDQLLPFAVGGPFTLQPVTGDNLLRPAWLPLAPAPFNLDLSSRPRCLWAHRVDPLPGAQVLLTLAGKPFLAVRQVGLGQVIACSGTVLGEPQQGGLPFWEAPSWPAVAEWMLR